MNKPSIAQLAYINSLYNELDTPFSERIKPQNAGQASVLIEDLKEDLNQFKQIGDFE